MQKYEFKVSQELAWAIWGIGLAVIQSIAQVYPTLDPSLLATPDLAVKAVLVAIARPVGIAIWNVAVKFRS